MQSILLYSVDSFVAALGLGLLGCARITRRKLILAFAACDLIAGLAGASLRAATVHIREGSWPHLLLPVILVVVAVAVLAYGRKSPSHLMWIPVLFSLDNFLAGLLGGPVHSLGSSLAAGAFSGLLAWSGFAMARVAGSLFSQRAALLASVGLTIIAFMLS
jgi:putative Mn2+ efflux pump MntP